MQILRVGPLVRAVNSTAAIIWVETFVPCLVMIQAQSQHNNDETTSTHTTHTVTASTSTTTVGGRFFAITRLQALQPATWYTYTLTFTSATQPTQTLASTSETSILHCFRTFPSTSVDRGSSQALRIAYGSCRKTIYPETDVFHALGPWLIQHYAQREQVWPHLLLLVGDQIYADEPGDDLIQRYPQLRDGAKNFSDFSQMYEYAWTYDAGTRQALAVLPTYMIFDDHEITNNWNTEPLWQIKTIQAGMESVLIDGLVAYWVYQGWGNLIQRDATAMPLLAIMDAATQNQEDAIAALRAAIRADLYQKTSLPWHYEIATIPPIFVANARTERTQYLDNTEKDSDAPMDIMSKHQIKTLLQWIHRQQTPATLVVSSVPLLLPPMIGLAEYIMGSRFWQRSHGPLRHLGRRLAHIQQRIASQNSFDHWPLYHESWKALVGAVMSETESKHTKDIIVLSGDVHFSYAMVGQRLFPSKISPRIYQLVSTPIQNKLDGPSQRKIQYQGYISRLFYDQLLTRVLRMHAVQNRTKNIHANYLFQNTLALVTVQISQHDYTIHQEYLGITHTQLDVIARTSFGEQNASNGRQ
jgi:phosphodiesterase/alkaline phosphatase D-like protein